MTMDDGDMNTALIVYGNAVAGQLLDVFGRDMTMAVARCAGCAREAEMGALMAFTRGPGVVLRCPACEAAIARIVETPTAIYVEARGATFLRLPPQHRPGVPVECPPGPELILRQPLLLSLLLLSSPPVTVKFAVILPTWS